MHDFKEWIVFVFAVVVGFLGGFDKWLYVLTFCIIIDTVIGWAHALISETWSFKIAFIGFFKKILIFTVIAIAFQVSKVLTDGGDSPLRNITIIYYTCYEGMSILKFVTIYIPVPDKLKRIFEMYKGGEKNEGKEN